MIGKTISSYKLIEVIGIGGMSTVYLGRHAKTGSVAAVKVLKEQYTQEKDHVKKFFIREIEVTKKLNHKNIVKLLNYGKKNGKYYLIYEYIDGLSLDKFLAKKKKLSIKAIEKIVLQILAGLSHAHSMEIIHRDIKPQNILVTDSGVTKITDFGIAKAVSSATITQTGLFMGSPAYISPEQAEGKEVSNSSDIYSLGIILFEMLTRKLPFTASTTWGIVNKHINEPPPDISKIAKSIPDYLTQTVSRCLNKDPLNRFDNAEEMANAISTKSYAGGTIIKNIEEIKTEPGIEKEFEVEKEENKISLKDLWMSINKKKLSIGAAVAAVIIWLIIGSSFYFVGNKYYNEDKYISAAHNFKAAQNMLIPNANNSKTSSLSYHLNNLNKLVELEEYEAVVINVIHIEENFPEYTEVENIRVQLLKAYNEKKDEYLVLIGNENFTDAKDVLLTMSLINGEKDSFIEKELLTIEDYAQSETYINQASDYLDEGTYDQMFEMIDLAKDLTSDYSSISKIESLITDEYNNLEYMHKDYFEDYDFENCLTVLNQMLSLRKGNDSNVEDQVEIVHMCIDSDNYITEAMDEAGQKNYDGALEILDYAIGENSDYGRIHTEYDIIKEMKEEYDGYIGQINHISNLNNSNNYLDAYNQANHLLNNSDFIEVVLQDDINRLNSIKSSAYNNGKNLPANSVSFNLHEGGVFLSKEVKNIFGNHLFNLSLTKRSPAGTNKVSSVVLSVSNGNYTSNLIAIISNNFSLDKGKWGSKDFLSWTKNTFPDAIADVARNNLSHDIDRNGYSFKIVLSNVVVNNNYIDNILISVSF